jgi:hypothetical protein
VSVILRRARTARGSAEVEAEEAISFLSFPLSSFLLFYPPELMRAVSASSLVNGVRNHHPAARTRRNDGGGLARRPPPSAAVNDDP